MTTAAEWTPLDVRTHFLDPMRAELRVRLPWPLEHGAEVRGRLMGPRCPFASTVEVAYPLRFLSATSGSEMQVIIPEPSLWEPRCPFLYEGPVEYWAQGQLRAKAWIRHGLRTLGFGAQGLMLNGRPFEIRGLTVERGSEADLLRLRQRGYTTLLAPVESVELWQLADRLGFLMLGRLTAASVSRADFLGLHQAQPVASLGWVLTEDVARSREWRDTLKRTTKADNFGLLFEKMPSQPLPKEVSFLVVAEPLVQELRPLRLPMIGWTEGAAGAATAGTATVGWVEGTPSAAR